MAQYLPDTERELFVTEALRDVCALRPSEWDRWSALASLAPHLTGDALVEGVAVAGSTDPEVGEHLDVRSRVIEELVERLLTTPREQMLAAWNALLPGLKVRQRTDLLVDLAHLMPLAATLGQAAGLAETVQALRDVGSWFP